MSGAGILHVVATPIGNRGDLSPRALDVLARADVILAEDTRTSAPLLIEAGVAPAGRLRAFHDHNEDALAERLVALLLDGKTLALVSDAGTPLVSDPGFALVRAARAAGIAVSPVPGPCAAVAALSVAGLPSDAFTFVGFPPAAAGPRARFIAERLLASPHSVVLYESSHRIEAFAQALAVACADAPHAARKIFVGRELTKRFEETALLPAGELAGWLTGHEHRARGEFVLVFEGLAQDTPAALPPAEALLKRLLVDLPASRAARLAAELTGRPRAELYALAGKLRGDARETGDAAGTDTAPGTAADPATGPGPAA